ncbi:DUF6623 family protein [Roseiflexus sp.]|uniref:DUF6623 family protein n=1 Tax=Roseiflexus sp. TaxID=2562120 RepID=UPI00398B546B
METIHSQSMWVHGHSMQVEDNEALAAIWRSGFCLYVEGKPDSLNWLHASIPTPACVGDHRTRVAAVVIVCRTMSNDAIVRDIHVYDGDVKIGDINDINLSGDIGMVRFTLLDHPEVQTAVGVSLGLSFGATALPHGISVTAVGVEFV